jgi:hypothetical protein
MAKKHVDPLKAKQKKQKIIAAVLSVVFLAVLGFEVPRVMKMMKTPPNPHAMDTTTATTPAGTPSLAAPTLRGAEQPPTTTDPTSGAGALASSGAPTVQDGQLASFSRFASKDPFSQQLSDSSTAPASPSSGSSGAGGSSGTGTPTQTPSSSSPQPGSAIISVNGSLYTVATKSDFPQASPLFHLISVTAHSAKISIVGGSYSTGAPAVTLRENKPVTLVNTADGTRYVLVLKPLGTSVPGGSTSTGAGSTVPSGTSGGSGAGTTTTPSSTTVTLPSP